MEPFVSRIAAAVAQEVGCPPETVLPLVQPSSNPERGDLSIACFQLAAKTGQPGKEAALALAAKAAGAEIEEVTAEAVGPFLNFRIDPTAVAREVLSAVWSRERYGGSDEGKGKTVVIDFSSPNIAKPFHLGHLRSTVIGWSIGRVYRALGYEVVGVNHLGDWGTQFGFMIAAWKRWGEEGEGRIEQGEREIDVFVDLYVRINALAEEDPQVRDEARSWFRRLEEGDPEAKELWELFKERSLREFERIYETLGITFESGHGEAFYNDKMPATVERLERSGLLVEGKTRKESAEEKHARAQKKLEAARRDLDNAETRLADAATNEKQRRKLSKKAEKVRGQIPSLKAAVEKAAAEIPATEDGLRPRGVDLSDERLGFCILHKVDGGTTYTTRDLTAAFYRGETYSPSKILYVVGADQRDHFLPWFRVIEKMGEPWAKGLAHVGFGRYLGMSTRKGTSVFLEEVLERAREKAREAASQATKKVELSPEETERVARAIGTGAIKFFDLKAERTKDIDLSLKGEVGIDWDRLLDLKGDTGPYLQFAYARLAGILRRYEGEVDPAAADFGLLGEPEPQALIKVLGEFPARIEQAAEEYEPSVIARYVVDLARKTHAFVHHHRVIDATPTAEQTVTPETLRASRVFLVACSRKVIAEALDLLGIESLEQM